MSDLSEDDQYTEDGAGEESAIEESAEEVDDIEKGWPSVQLKRLIQEVKKPEYVFLYDNKHRDHKKRDKRATAFDQIAELVFENQKTGSQCKEAWERLRSSYRATKSRKRKGLPSGSGGGEVSGKVKWKFWSQMTFLDGFDVNRRSISNTTTPADTQATSQIPVDTNRGRPKRGKGSGKDDSFEMELLATLSKASDVLDADNKDSDEDFHFANSVYAKLLKIDDPELKFSVKHEIDVVLHNATKRASGFPPAQGYSYHQNASGNPRNGNLGQFNDHNPVPSTQMYGGFDPINYGQPSTSHH